MDPTILAWGTEITTANGNEEDSFPNAYGEPFIINSLNLIVAFIGLAGNAIVLWLLGFHMRRNSFCVYILNLAIADFLYLCCHIIYILLYFSFSYSIETNIHGLFITVTITVYITGLGLLSTISIERCLAVRWPIWYRCHRRRHTSAAMCALLWALSLLLSILEGDYCGLLLRGFDYNWCPTFDFITAGWLIILFAFLCGSSLTLLLMVFCSSRPKPLTRLYVTVLLTVLVFLLCGLPLGIQRFILSWIMMGAGPSFWYASQVLILLSCINSSANPFIYFFVGSFRQRLQQRQTIRQILQRALQDVPEEASASVHFQESLAMSGSNLEQ